MITTKDCFAKYGDPKSQSFMTVWDVPAELEHGLIPKKLYCNKDMVGPLTAVFKSLIETGCINELKSWDGCFNVRVVRGYESIYNSLVSAGKQAEADDYLSIHSWAVVVDVNAAENGLGQIPKLSAAFVKCFTDAGFDWGGLFSRKDGMHFQLAKI